MRQEGKAVSLFQDRLPEEIVRELTPEVRRQYFLWDEIMKREIELYPRLILPVVKEIFHREYPEGGEVTLLSTEYTVSRVHESGEKLLHAIRSDLLLKIGRELYHFECQIEKDGKMVFRMLEYDLHIALTHGKGGECPEEFAVSFPKSAVLYLGNEENVPEYESCVLHFQDGTEHLYKVPVLRVQGYSPEELEERHLNILMPFLPVRFRERIKKVSGWEKEKAGAEERRAETGEKAEGEETGREGLRKAEREALGRELTEFILRCTAVLDREEERKVLSERVRKDIGELLWKACGYLLEGDAELYREVSEEVEPAIKLSREIIEELREDIEELQGSNRELQENISELHQDLENSYRRLTEKARSDGKTERETEEELMTVFALSESAAKEKIKVYWKRE